MYGRVAGVCLATTLFICGIAGFPTPPSSLPASTGSLELTEDGSGNVPRLAPGASIEVRGGGFAADAAVTVAVYSQPRALGETFADGKGEIDVDVKLPADLPEGQHTVTALGLGPNGSAVVLTQAIVVGGASSASELAYTGFSVLTYLAAAVFLVVVGLVLVRTGLMRRRLLPEHGDDRRVG